MAANVESLFFVGRQTPWHGMGVSIENAPTSKDAIVAAGLDWEVRQERLYTEFSEELATGFVANMRSDVNRFLGAVSDKYQVVQNRDAFAIADNLLGEGCVYETAGSLAGGRRVWVLAKMPEKYKIFDDKIDPYFLITNSHDGSSAVKMCMTPVRVVCQNTLNFALNSATRKYSCRHTANVNARMQEAGEILKVGEEYMQRLQSEADELRKIKLTEKKVKSLIADLIKMPENAGERQARNVIEKRDEIFLRYNDAPDLQNLGKDGWRLMQAITDYATHSNRFTKNKEGLFVKTVDGNDFVDKSLILIKAVA